jgi:hypothetical protein
MHGKLIKRDKWLVTMVRTTLTSVSAATGPLTQQTSQLRSALLRVVTQRVVVIPYRGRPESRYGITTTRCETIQKSADLIYIAANAWNHANPQLSWADIHKSRELVGQTTKFCTVASNIFGSSTRNLLHVNLLASRILKWLLDFGKFVHPLSKINVYSALRLWMAYTSKW